MEKENDAVSPVKLRHQKNLEVKPYNCLICGKRAGNAGLLEFLEIKALLFS